MAELLLASPSLSVFWTAYDPLDLASDSIDPLGFLAPYVTLADRILPGLTTITTVPRYAGMLCSALRGARAIVGDSGPIATRRRKVIEYLKLFERAWAVACGYAEEDAALGRVATDGVRGIRAIHRHRTVCAGREKVALTFALLSNQVRYGGIGAYSTFLEAVHLADMQSLLLRPLGEKLAEAFPAPEGFGIEIVREDSRHFVESLREWGKAAHAGAASESTRPVCSALPSKGVRKPNSMTGHDGRCSA